MSQKINISHKRLLKTNQANPNKANPNQANPNQAMNNQACTNASIYNTPKTSAFKNTEKSFQSEKGSISIFLVIIIPVLILGLLMVYVAMRDHVNENKMMHITADTSQVRLSLKSDLMSDQYRLLVYANDGRLDDLLSDMVDENRLTGLYHWEIETECLDSPESYYASVEVAARYAFAEDTIKGLVSKVSQMKSVTDLAGKMKDKADKVSELGEKMKTKDLYKLAGKMKKASDILGKIENFDQKLTEKEKTFMETYNAIEDKTDMVVEAKEQFDQKNKETRQQISQLESLGHQQEALNQSIASCEDRIDQLEDELKALKRQEKEANKETEEAEDSSKGKPSQESSVDYQPQMDAIRDQIDREEEAIDDLEDQLEQINDQIKDKASHLADSLKQSTSNWVEKLKDLKALAFDKKDEEESDEPSDQLDKVKEKDLYTHNGASFDDSQVAIYDKVMMDEYFLSIYSNRLKDKREHGPFKSEVEYLLTGDDNENASKFKVRSKIFGLRELCNIMAVMMDGQAQSDILEMCTPLPYPYKVIAYGVINLAWASAESYLDTQKLCNGDNLPLIKSTQDFELSLTGIKHLDVKSVKNKSKEIAGKELQELSNDNDKDGHSSSNPNNQQEKDGLEVNYEDHLRLLLFTQGFDKTLLRSMDLMTWSLSDNDQSLGDFARGHHIKVLKDNNLLLEMDNDYE